MRLALVLVAALFLTGGLAGCLGGKDAPAKPAAINATNTSKVAIDTGNSANASGDMGQVAHMHDYWNGKERITLVDQDLNIQPQDALAQTFTNTFRYQDPAVGGTTVRPPDNVMVFEGTGKMEITATWSSPTVSSVTVRYRSAASSDWSQPKPLTSGAPLPLEITPDMTDMPHSKTSRWVFQLMPAQGGVIEGALHFRVDIVRMRDISLWPAHGDLFGGAHTLVLFDGQATSSHQGAESAIVDRATNNGDSPPEGVQAAKVVPMETMWMTANVTITDATAQFGQVRNISFLYKTADSSNFRRANVTHSDFAKGVFQFSWPVKMQQTDSPYDKQSQWRFDLQIATSDPSGQLGQCGICSDAQVQYKLQVVAYDAAHPELPPIGP
ncbi:MAG: hypothetical protein QOE90_354 [Thermoplasmata archaeon]|jgi:hypothetical protein|nr:hypothetical protein [Thermoplasmata archaeon]